MVDKSIVFDHVYANYPLQKIADFGFGLASGSWDRDEELYRLTEVLADLHVDTDLATQDLEALDDTSGNLSQPDTIPFVINAIRRGIFYRNLPHDAVISPEIQKIYDSNWKGIWGADGKLEAMSASFLLTTFITGLDRGGFPIGITKEILRQQIEDVMKRECDGRTSYSSIAALRFMYRVMKYSQLHTPETKLAQIKRGQLLLSLTGYRFSD